MKSPHLLQDGEPQRLNKIAHLLKQAIQLSKDPSKHGAAEKIIEMVLKLPGFKYWNVKLDFTPEELCILWEVMGRVRNGQP